MTKALIRKFVPDYENVKNAKVREQYGKLAGIGGLVVNTVLAVVKILLGLLFASVSLMADGVNNLTDASSSIITLVSFRLAAKPADDEHPFSHARIEFIAGLMVSFLVIFLAFELFLSSFKKILHPEPAEFSALSLLVLVLAILAKLWLSRFYLTLGEAISSPTLKASGEDSRNDVVSTSAVLVCACLELFFHWHLDGYFGVLVAVYIVLSGIGLIKETAGPLLGEKPDPELVCAVHDCVISHEGVLGVHDLIVHNYGPSRMFASVHVEVDANVDVMLSHDRMDHIEREVMETLGVQLVCHMDPVRPDDPFVQEATELISGILAEIPGILNYHDLRVVTGPTHNNIVFDIVIPHKFSMSEDELKRTITQKVQKDHPTYYPVVTIDREYARTLPDER